MLIIDAGSCITYDFINDKNQYLGGAISPGINMRFKSLNNYTSKLPLISPAFTDLVKPLMIQLLMGFVVVLTMKLKGLLINILLNTKI